MSEIEEYNFCWDDYYQSRIDQRQQLQFNAGKGSGSGADMMTAVDPSEQR